MRVSCLEASFLALTLPSVAIRHTLLDKANKKPNDGSRSTDGPGLGLRDSGRFDFHALSIR